VNTAVKEQTEYPAATLAALAEATAQIQAATAQIQADLGALREELRADLPLHPPTWPSEQDWAQEYGIDLGKFAPFEAPPLGTYTMTVAEAALETGLGEEQVRRRLRAGTLRGVAQTGKAGWRVVRADVDRLAREKSAQRDERRRKPGATTSATRRGPAFAGQQPWRAGRAASRRADPSAGPPVPHLEGPMSPGARGGRNRSVAQ